MKDLGANLLVHLRDVVSEEKGLNVEKIRTELYTEKHPDDSYAKAAAKQEKERKKDAPKRGRGSGRRALKCWYCGMTGHAAQKCFKRQQDGAPLPTGPRSGNDHRGEEAKTKIGTK